MTNNMKFTHLLVTRKVILSICLGTKIVRGIKHRHSLAIHYNVRSLICWLYSCHSNYALCYLCTIFMPWFIVVARSPLEKDPWHWGVDVSHRGVSHMISPPYDECAPYATTGQKVTWSTNQLRQPDLDKRHQESLNKYIDVWIARGKEGDILYYSSDWQIAWVKWLRNENTCLCVCVFVCVCLTHTHKSIYEIDKRIYKNISEELKRKVWKEMRSRGIEPRSVPWEGTMIPLHQLRLYISRSYNSLLNEVLLM